MTTLDIGTESQASRFTPAPKHLIEQFIVPELAAVMELRELEAVALMFLDQSLISEVLMHLV